MAAINESQQKPYLLLEYFPLSSRWHDCHVKEMDAKEADDELGAFVHIPCKFCAKRAEQTSESSQIDEIFARYVQRAQVPSSTLSIEMKMPQASFNHVHDFIISEGIIWSRRRLSPDQKWTSVYFDGFQDGIFPCSLHADGANLVVLDNQGYVHYKKVLREHRRTDLVQALMVRDDWHIRAPYIAVDKAAKKNWKQAWFTLPVLSGIVNLVDGKKIKIPSDALAWGISHRGAYNHCYEDDEGIAHPVNTGVTTLYVLLSSGKDIQKLDPWSPPKSDMNITVTDTAQATFRAFDMSPSASTIMLIGYESRAGLNGGTSKILKVKTRLADIDTEGLNPGLQYTYFKERTKGEVIRIISKGEWQDHPLPDTPLLTGAISIMQTGEGNQTRQLRLEAYGPENQLGYYFKMISETAWQFNPYKTQPSELKEIKPLKIETEEPFRTTVYNCVATSYKMLDSVPRPERIELCNFGKYSETSTITFYFPDGEETLILRRRKTFANFLGAKDQAYDLINYAEDIENAKLNGLFTIFDKRLERVFVSVNQSEVILQGFRFRLIFKRPFSDQALV